LPKTRLDFWEPKLAGNAARDVRKTAELETLGWQVLVIWECETSKLDALTALAQRILSAPRRSQPFCPLTPARRAGERAAKRPRRSQCS